MRIIPALERKGAGLRLNLSMDTSTPTGKLMLTVLGGIAQFEREMMLEGQREGTALFMQPPAHVFRREGRRLPPYLPGHRERIN